MAKEILLYGYISDYSAQIAMQQMIDSDDKDFTLRVNTSGGDPESIGGLVAKIQEAGIKRMKVDDKAYSAGACVLLFADDVECLDTSNFMIHRAALSEYQEENEVYFTGAIRENLESVNANLDKAMKARIDVQALQTIMDEREYLKGAKVKDIFSMDSRIEITLNAKEAKKIKLVDRIISITPQKRAEIAQNLSAVWSQKAAFALTPVKKAEVPDPEIPIEEPKNDYMKAEEYKAKHPAEYEAIRKEAAAAEKERIDAIMVFIAVDPKVCLAAIESGKALTPKQINEMVLKQASKLALAGLEKESAEGVTTEEETEEEKAAKLQGATVIKKVASKGEYQNPKEAATFEKLIQANLKQYAN